MKIKFLYIKDNGVLDKERVVLLVEEDCDLGHYLIATSHFKPDAGTFSSKIKNVFWFPDREVKKGDKIIVYTKKGIHNKQENEDQTTSHFFYWGIEAPLNSKNDETCVVVFNASWLVERVPYSNGN